MRKQVVTKKSCVGGSKWVLFTGATKDGEGTGVWFGTKSAGDK